MDIFSDQSLLGSARVRTRPRTPSHHHHHHASSTQPHVSSCRCRIVSAAFVTALIIVLGTSDTVLIGSVSFLSKFGIFIETDNEEYNLETLQSILKSNAPSSSPLLPQQQPTNDIDESTKKNKDKNRRIRSIHFIGERHSGTTWMYNHLRRCFSDSLPVHMGYTRFKHWFQYNDTNSTSTESSSHKQHHGDRRHALVIAQFREPYSWVESMRHENHHAPMHAKLGWHKFVTLDWWMPRPKKDLILANATGRVCGQNFYYNEVVPCSEDVFRRRGGHPRYELRIDGSGLPYRSIVELRRDKIRNFLEVAQFAGVADHLSVRYEDIVVHGSDDILQRIEKATGVKAKCRPKPKQNLTAKTYRPGYVDWMNKHVDWSTEALLGYGKCNSPVGPDNTCIPILGKLLEWNGILPKPFRLQ